MTDIVERLRGRGIATSLELEAADEIERLRELKEHARKCCDEAEAENERLRAQIAEQGFIIQQTQIDRDTWRSNYHGVAEQIAAKEAAWEETRRAVAHLNNENAALKKERDPA